jgi:hypothetical protein
MQSCKVVLQFPQHRASVTVKEDSIHVFKFSAQTCDFYVFDTTEQMEASEYIMTPLPTIQYRVTFPGDPE